MVSPDAVTLGITAAGIGISWAGSAFIAGYRWGTVKTRLDVLEISVSNSASREQLSGVKEDLAEIKGMFRMVPKDGSIS